MLRNILHCKCLAYILHKCGSYLAYVLLICCICVAYVLHLCMSFLNILRKCCSCRSCILHGLAYMLLIHRIYIAYMFLTMKHCEYNQRSFLGIPLFLSTTVANATFSSMFGFNFVFYRLKSTSFYYIFILYH